MMGYPEYILTTRWQSVTWPEKYPLVLMIFPLKSPMQTCQAPPRKVSFIRKAGTVRRDLAL